MSDGQQLGYVRADRLKRMAIPKELKKIDVIFFHNESYIYNIKFYAKNGEEFSMRDGGNHGPGRVETVEFAHNQHLLSCEFDYSLNHHDGLTEITGITWIKWSDI